MKIRFEKKYFYLGLTVFLVFVACLCVYYVFFHFSSLVRVIRSGIKICMPVIDGVILAYLLTPLLNKIEEKIVRPLYARSKKKPMTKKRERGVRRSSILVTMLIFILAVYGFFALVIPEIIRSIQSIIFQFPAYVTNLGTWVTKLLEKNPQLESTVASLFDQSSTILTDFFNASILPRINDMLKTVSLSLIGILKALWNFIIGFIISIYILASKELFSGQAKKIAYAFMRRNVANKVIYAFRFVNATFSGFIIGKIVDSIIIGIICFICAHIIGFPYATLISVIIGVTNIIPFFGPFFGAVPSALLILLVNPIQCIYFIIMILIIQQVDGNIIGPKILGNSTGLSSFWVIFAITFFGGIFGVMGMIIGVPVFAVIYAAFKMRVDRSLKKKKLPTATAPYLEVGSIGSDGRFHKKRLHKAKMQWWASFKRWILSVWHKIHKKKKDKDVMTDNTENADHADNADNAANTDNADNAENADHADNTDNVDNATNTDNAENAGITNDMQGDEHPNGADIASTANDMHDGKHNDAETKD